MWKPVPVEGAIAAEQCYAKIDVQLQGKLFGSHLTSLELRCTTVSWSPPSSNTVTAVFVHQVKTCEKKVTKKGVEIKIDSQKFVVSNEHEASLWMEQFEV